MAIPKVTFNIATNSLGRNARAIEKIAGIVSTGVTVADKIKLGEAYQIFSLKDAENLGITQKDNPFAYKHIFNFYNQAGNGTPLWLMLVSDATTMTDVCDKTQPYASKLIAEAKGTIRVLGVVKQSTGAENIENGLDADVTTAVVSAQKLAEHFANKYFPVRIILSGNAFNGKVSDLKDYEESEFTHVNVLIANNDGKKDASIGLCLGRQATIPSQRRQNRVKDGAVINLEAYFTNGESAESLTDAWDTIDDKRYTFFRSFPNRSGYFFTGDKTLCTSKNDFSKLAMGFVMDEAVLIAFDKMVSNLSDEIPFLASGEIHPAIIKSWQGEIESAITLQMIDQKKISNVKVYIDPNQNVLQTDKVIITIKIQPVGYADFIEVNIGFTTKIEE